MQEFAYLLADDEARVARAVAIQQAEGQAAEQAAEQREMSAIIMAMPRDEQPALGARTRAPPTLMRSPAPWRRPNPAHSVGIETELTTLDASTSSGIGAPVSSNPAAGAATNAAEAPDDHADEVARIAMQTMSAAHELQSAQVNTAMMAVASDLCEKHEAIRQAADDLAKEWEAKLALVESRYEQELKEHAHTTSMHEEAVAAVMRMADAEDGAAQLPDVCIKLAVAIDRGDIAKPALDLILDIAESAGKQRSSLSGSTRELFNRMASHSPAAASVLAMNLLANRAFLSKRNIVAHANATVGREKTVVVIPLGLPTDEQAEAIAKLLVDINGAYGAPTAVP